jgi:uncharacterized protein
MAGESSAAPVRASERIAMLDALRGFALFGILLANLMSFIGTPGQTPDALLATRAGLDAAVPIEFFLEWLVVGKFYSLFSLLFGIGFAIQLERLNARGEGVGRYVRRLLVLFGFGLLHMLLLWLGDILALYALVGLLLLLFRRVSDRSLLVGAALLWLVPIGWSAAQAWGGFDPGAPFIAGALRTFAWFGLDASVGPYPIWSSPDYLVHLKAHPGEMLFRYHDLIEQARPAKVLAMFLIGLWIGRRRVLADPAAHRKLLRRMLLAGFALGLPIALARALMTTVGQDAAVYQVWQEAAYCIGTPLLALGYAAAFALLWERGRPRLGWLAPAGRMALTNYLAQTLIQCILIYGWGFGLIGRIHLGFVPPLAIAIFALQVGYSRWWLAQYRFGPLEWLWRTLTYGRAQPMRIEAAAGPLPA